MAAGVLIALAVAVTALFLLLRPKSEATAGSSAGPLPGVLTGTAPWPNNTADLSARLDRLALGAEGTAQHIHPHLDIFVNGQQLPIPADIGLTGSLGSPLHTHDATGVIHVESASANRLFNLGQFFGVWGVRFTPTCIGGYCASGDQTIRVFVDGTPFNGDPRSVVLKDQEQIVLTFGTKAQVPDPLPTYDFSSLQP